QVELPVYMPDATYGYVRALTSHDLRQVELPALMMNAFHLMQKPGSTVIQSLGGLHRMADWDGLIMTDSGRFQAYSMIRQNPKFGSLTPKGIIFRPENSNRKLNLSPEKSIQLQFGYGSDVLICLDDCTHINASYQEQKESVERTIAWAKLAKQTYLQQLSSRKTEESERPLIFGVIQGGAEADLRRQCAEALLEIGFDGFGFGGWPLDEDSNLITDILELVRSLIPQEFTIHALGIGHPESIVTAYKIGYDMFDSALPTRDARHGRLYRKDGVRLTPDTPSGWLKFTYINTETFIRDPNPIEVGCDCPVCQNYSLGYLYHLYKMRDPSYFRLATMHNLRFMTRVIADLKASHAG
ncbi:MAG: tRNA guanosine(34) transglycosylase Tgt, partial [Anaerolineaceae bacterium]